MTELITGRYLDKYARTAKIEFQKAFNEDGTVQGIMIAKDDVDKFNFVAKKGYYTLNGISLSARGWAEKYDAESKQNPPYKSVTAMGITDTVQGWSRRYEQLKKKVDEEFPDLQKQIRTAKLARGNLKNTKMVRLHRRFMPDEWADRAMAYEEAVRTLLDTKDPTEINIVLKKLKELNK